MTPPWPPDLDIRSHRADGRVDTAACRRCGQWFRGIGPDNLDTEASLLYLYRVHGCASKDLRQEHHRQEHRRRAQEHPP
jgi:hypothetical protein